MLSPRAFYCFCNEISSQLHMVHIHSYHSFFLCVSYFYWIGMQHLQKKKKKTQMVQPPKDQDGSFFGKLHCKPQYKFPLIEKARFQFFYQKMLAAVVRSLQIEIYPTASMRERKDGRKTFRNCRENAMFLLLSGVVHCGCLKRNWAEWGRDVFWSTWQIPYHVWVFFLKILSTPFLLFI